MSASRTRKTIGIMFGLLFIGIGVAIVVLAEPRTRPGSFLAAVLLAALGLDQVVASVRERASLLERIGPLP